LFRRTSNDHRESQRACAQNKIKIVQKNNRVFQQNESNQRIIDVKDNELHINEKGKLCLTEIVCGFFLSLLLGGCDLLCLNAHTNENEPQNHGPDEENRRTRVEKLTLVWMARRQSVQYETPTRKKQLVLASQMEQDSLAEQLPKQMHRER
jgi:hypothetical protein